MAPAERPRHAGRAVRVMPRHTLVLVALLLGAAGCVRSNVVVGAPQLHGAVPELRETGSARVEGHRVTLETRARLRGRPFSGERVQSIGELIGGCPDLAPVGAARRRAARDCPLLRARSVDLGERIEWGPSAAMWAGAIVVVGVVGALLGLLVAADSSDSHCDLDCGP